jgi:hypothetical protein
LAFVSGIAQRIGEGTRPVEAGVGSSIPSLATIHHSSLTAQLAQPS